MNRWTLRTPPPPFFFRILWRGIFVDSTGTWLIIAHLPWWLPQILIHVRYQKPLFHMPPCAACFADVSESAAHYEQYWKWIVVRLSTLWWHLASVRRTLVGRRDIFLMAKIHILYGAWVRDGCERSRGGGGFWRTPNGNNFQVSDCRKNASCFWYLRSPIFSPDTIFFSEE